MHLTVYSSSTCKKGEHHDDCQDAFSVKDSRYAIADGATLSFFPKWWAELLVEDFCSPSDLSPTQENWKGWLVPIQKKWSKKVEERVKAKNLFYLTNSFRSREPAVSTFIGLEIEKVERRWKVTIIGDSCLFHESKSGFESYLIKSSEDFTSSPDGFASYAEWIHHEPEFIEGEFHSGDRFILATDALSKWILEPQEADRLKDVFNQFEQIKKDELPFEQFVEQARASEDIRLVNDDVTLMLISVGDSEGKGSHRSRDEGRANVLERVLWGLLIGVFSFWTLYWVLRFLRDLFTTLFQ